MEILTLLKANIRKKKSTFISIMMLTAIIVATMTSIIAVQDNYNQALTEAFDYEDTGDVTAFVRTPLLAQEIKQKVENSELVERVTYVPVICSNGTTVGEVRDGNSYFMMELLDGICLYNENLDGFEEEIPALEKGEIYLPLGLKSKLKCEVGDTVRLDLILDHYVEFKIKGFVQEPSQGALNIGWKQTFISKEDYELLYGKYQPLETEEIFFSFNMIRIYQAKDVEVSTTKFQRQLNLETRIIDVAAGALNTDQSIRYSTLMPNVVTDIVLAFCICLFVIILIVMSHSISTEIEIDYVSLGILKSQGFSKGKLRLIILLQYLLAQLAGILVGVLVAVPIEKEVSRICQGITAVLPKSGLSFPKIMGCAGIILLASALLILLKTCKVAKISPVRAISGGKEDIYFDSPVRLPISKKFLLTSLSFRQFVSAKRRYFGSVFIVGILVFCMVTVNLTGNLLSSRKGLSAMGLVIPDLEVFYNEKPENEKDYWKDVERMIESHSAITEKNAVTTGYASLNGENLYCEIYKYPEFIPGIKKGRAPLYDNEILITEMVAEALEIQMGDKVTVAFQNKTDSFVVSGIYQTGSDSGMAFSMNFEAAEKMGANTFWAYRYYVLEDNSKLHDIVKDIQGEYGDLLGMNVYEAGDNSYLGEYDAIVNVLKVIIYLFSILFAFVVVRMVCTKTFIQERRDIGIYKALGFTSKRLRRCFGVRFLIIAVLGSMIGAILSVLFSAKLLGIVLSLIGLDRVVLDFSLAAVLIPAIVISTSVFLFAYVASAKIKKVEIKELVIE